MATETRFGDVSDQDLENLMENRDSLSTKNVIKGAVNILEKYCVEKDISLESQVGDNASLNDFLCKFYAALRTNDGNLYSKKSFLSIRYGLQKHFEKKLNVDIVNNPEFSSSCKIFKSMLVKLKQEGKARVNHKQPLSKEDLRKLYESFDVNTPQGLQDKVFVDFMLYFCNRGRENMRILKKSDFQFDEANDSIEMRDMLTKNHKGDVADGESQGGRIYKTDDRMCPFNIFKQYLDVLNPAIDEFFQRPKEKPKAGQPWFDRVPLGRNSLGDKMKHLSTKAGLSRIYTNHCLRATSITLLNGFEARHVMTVSGSI